MDEREAACAPTILPPGLEGLTEGRAWARDLVGEAGCAVYRLHRAVGEDLYLKHGPGDFAGDVIDEAVRLRWLAPQVSVPDVRGLVVADDAAWLLMSAIAGPTAWQMLDAEPESRGRIVDALADFLRRLHAIPIDRCPFEAGHVLRLAHARERLEAGLIDEADFGDDHEGWSARRLWDAMTALPSFEPERVVTHGDFSLDNLILRDGAVAGCIDVGRAGVADRYQDIAILWECLGEFDAGLRARFLHRYGIADIDETRLRFHLMLDECF